MKTSKTLSRCVSALALIGAVLIGIGAPALASGGSGGGGGNSGGGNSGGGGNARHGGKYNLTFNYAPAINGRIPVCTGAYGLTTYITTLSLDIRMSSCNLPDGTPLTVTAYANDYFTGQPWPAKVAGTMKLTSHSASLAISALWTTPAGGLPVLTSVVITAPDGSIVASGHP